MAVMGRSGVWMIAGWAVVAVATAAVGTAALDIVGAGILGPDNRPLSQADVARELAAARPAPATPSPSSAPPSSPQSGPAPRGLSATGGSLVVICDGDVVTLQSWSPAQGFRADDDIERGPGPAASLKFKRGREEYEVTATCRAGEPHIVSVPDDH
jgi:serine/threonine-protein kinase